MNYIRCRATHFLSTSSMRVCQPVPVDLKYSTTSRLYRTVTDSLVCGALGRPRGFSISAATFGGKSCGSSSRAGRARAMSSRVISGISPSSHFCVSFALGLRCIKSHLSCVSLAQADHANQLIAWCENQNMKPAINLAKREKTRFAIIPSHIRKNQRATPGKGICDTEIHAMFGEVSCALGFIPLVDHAKYCSYSNSARQELTDVNGPPEGEAS